MFKRDINRDNWGSLLLICIVLRREKGSIYTPCFSYTPLLYSLVNRCFYHQSYLFYYPSTPTSHFEWLLVLPRAPWYRFCYWAWDFLLRNQPGYHIFLVADGLMCCHNWWCLGDVLQVFQMQAMITLAFSPAIFEEQMNSNRSRYSNSLAHAQLITPQLKMVIRVCYKN